MSHFINRYFKNSLPRAIPQELSSCIKECSHLLKRSQKIPMSWRLAVRLGIPLRNRRQEGPEVSWPNEQPHKFLRAYHNSSAGKTHQSPPGSHVWVMCDNTTAVNIVRRGRSWSAHLKHEYSSIQALKARSHTHRLVTRSSKKETNSV